MNGGVVGISISMSMNPGRVVCGSIAVAVVPITGTCVPVATDEAWAAMVGGSAVQVGPSTFNEMGKWIGGTGWPIHTFAEMVGGSVSVDSSTFSEVVAESAVDTFAKVVGRSAVAFAEAWAISMIGGTTPGACSVVDGAGEIDIAGSLLPAFCYETMYCLKQMIKRAYCTNLNNAPIVFLIDAVFKGNSY